jgi:hypothetical protein
MGNRKSGNGGTARCNATGYAAFFCAAFHFAQRALCAAEIFLRAAAERARRGFAVPVCLFGRVFAQRAFCARLIFRRAAADIVRRCPLAGRPDFELPKASSAASIRSTSFCARSRSFLKCWTTPDRFPIGSPSARDHSRRPTENPRGDRPGL